MDIGVGAGVAWLEADVLDVRSGFRNLRGELGQDATLIGHHKADVHGEQAVHLAGPLHVDPFVRIPAGLAYHRAVVGVDHQAHALLEVADDGIARDGVAALGHLQRHAVRASNHHRARQTRVFRVRLVAQLKKTPCDHEGQLLAQADVGEDLLAAGQVAIAQELVPVSLGHLLRTCLQR